MRVLFVHQNHSSSPGFVGDAYTSLGYDATEFTVVPRERYDSPDVTVTFPDPLGYDAIVAFGAAWAVYDEEAIGTWIHDEIAFTRAAIAGGVPFLGICFGGQLLATALGGSVARAPEPEVGWYTVETSAPGLTGPGPAEPGSAEPGRAEPGGLIEPGPWFQWHVDRFTVPDSVKVVARTSRASQAFVSGRSLGLQFHPELTSSLLATWLEDGGKAELTGLGVDTDDLLARTRAVEGEAATRTHELVRRFVCYAASAPIDATVLTP
ncbi:MAG TPA: type 1 glutamine amidotransferase [Trebonia sp.]|jgi:GMP synthase-like glutamine amidotransferase|nr:type 1 glutamine amidotransferase [Trebonia sp.]